MFQIFPIIFRNFSTKLQTENEPITKVLKIAVIGIPNAGKSTFINQLMDRKVCPTSSKVHTTRTKTRAIFTEGASQIVFVDTPGVVNLNEYKRYKLEKSFLKDGKSSLQKADIIGVIHDSSNIWTREKLDIKIIKLLEQNQNKPSFLVFNKVDSLKSKRKLLDLTRIVTENKINGEPIPSAKPIEKSVNRGWPYFREIFMISALTGDGLEPVKKYFIENAKPAPWLFPAETWSDQPTEQLIVASVKAKLLDFLPQEIPYLLKPELEFYEINSQGIINTSIIVHCPTERISKLVSGHGDGKLRQIVESLQSDLQHTFQTYVRIKVIVKSKTKE